MRNINAIALREVRAYFQSPIAYIVLFLFAGVSAFVFFNVKKFFAAERAELRGFFEIIPLVFLFLVPGLTMRLWSEEKKAGTLELLMTLPVKKHQYVIGKFLGAWTLVAVALLFTAVIPVSVSMLGPLDMGPVLGGYLAAFLLGGTFVAIGIFMSAVTENQIVALLGAMIVGLLLYIPGTEQFLAFLPEAWVGTAQSVGLGSRFQSIERGVVDFRDLLYYVSLIFLFLAANVAVLVGRRWN